MLVDYCRLTARTLKGRYLNMDPSRPGLVLGAVLAVSLLCAFLLSDRFLASALDWSYAFLWWAQAWLALVTSDSAGAPLAVFGYIFLLTGFSLSPLLLSQRCGPYPGLWLPTALIPAHLTASVILLSQRIYPPMVSGLTALILAQILALAVRAAESRLATRTSRAALSLYLNPALAAEIVKRPELLSRAGERREMTVFFSDLVGFATLAEHLSPEDLVAILDRYFETMEPPIADSGGILDKFSGDAIMAFWGSPLILRTDHAASGCLAALDQQAALSRLNERLRAEGRPPLSALMGLNTGPMVVGNIGAERRLNYTVMGDAVNLAARLVPVNKIYQTQILVSEAVARAAGAAVETRTLDRITVAGRAESLTIFEVLGRPGEVKDEIRRGRDLFEDGLKWYFRRNFQKALGLFEATLALFPADGPAELLAARCRAFLREPPGDDWPGVTALNIK